MSIIFQLKISKGNKETRQRHNFQKIRTEQDRVGEFHETSRLQPGRTQHPINLQSEGGGLFFIKRCRSLPLPSNQLFPFLFCPEIVNQVILKLPDFRNMIHGAQLLMVCQGRTDFVFPVPNAPFHSLKCPAYRQQIVWPPYS